MNLSVYMLLKILRFSLLQSSKLCLFLVLIFFVPTAFAHSQTIVVEMTSEGFKPQIINLDTSGTVIFINKDSKAHWPASDVHPTHDLYSQFDPQRGIEPGESWPFRPKKTGEWKFHDHLFPHFRGSVTVISEQGEKEKSVSWIEKVKTGLQNFFSKIKNSLGPKITLNSSGFTKLDPGVQINQLKKYADSRGAEKAWQFIKETYKGQGGSFGNIHDLAHLSGGLLFEELGFPGLGKCSVDFAFGCFHGFLDKAFQKNLDRLNEAEGACSTLGSGGPYASCVHGIGHGIASFYQSADLKAALSSCKRLGTQSLQYCFDGVFMEFERSAPPDFYSKTNPYYPCDGLEAEFGAQVLFACGRNQPTVLMSKFKFSFEDVVGVCLKSPSDQFKTACFDALGFITSKSTSDPNSVISACRKIGVDEYISRCAKAAAGELIFQEVPGWQTNAPLICKILPINYQSDCQGYINELIRQYGREVVK